MSKVYVIGVGVDGPESIAPRGQRLIARSSMIVAGRRHLESFPGFIGTQVAITGGLDRVAARIRDELERGGNVAVLATGDPLLFGIGRFIVDTFGVEKVEVVPGVSTVQEAFARIGESWNGARILSVHGGGGRGGADGERSLARVVDELVSAERAAVYTDARSTPANIARELLGRGESGYVAWVCESLGAPDERVTRYSVESLARKRSFAPLNVLLLIRNPVAGSGGRGPAGAPGQPPHRRPVGIPDADFSHSSGMITKSEIRAVVLSKLAISPADVVWDVGACSGSVAIEAALGAEGGRVYAIEKNARRVRDIRANVRKFGAGNVVVIEGTAPECISEEGLPAPDAVFVGGGGAGITGILVYAARRLKRGGRMVVNSVTMETTAAAHGFFRKKGWEADTVLVSLARSKSAGALSLLSANNPVFIITARRPL